MLIDFKTYQRWFESCEPQFPYVYHKVYGNKAAVVHLANLDTESINVMLDEYTSVTGYADETRYQESIAFLGGVAGWPPHIPRLAPTPAPNLAPPVPQVPIDYMGITRAVIGVSP